MRKMWLRSLALSLGVVAAGARGQEVARSQPPAASLGAPVAIATSRPKAAPVATLGAPVAIASTAKRDAAVQQVTFMAARPSRPVVRGSMPEVAPARPMPLGPDVTSPGMPAAGMHTWQTGTNVVASTVSRNPNETGAAPPPPRPGAESLLVPPTPVPMPQTQSPMPQTQTPGPMMTNPGPMMMTPQPGVVMQPGTGPMPGMVLTPGVAPEGPFPAQGVPGVIAGGNGCCPTTCAPTCCGDNGCGWNGGGRGFGAGGWGCGGGGCCDNRPAFEIGFEALLWATSGDATPPLVSVGPTGATQANVAQTFLNGGGLIASGGKRMGDNVRPGGRLYGVYWIDEGHCWGVDFSAFYLGNSDDGSVLLGGLSPQNIGRPFLNTTPGTNAMGQPFAGPDAEEVVGPNLNGSVQVTRQSNLWGADLNLRRNIWCCDNFWGDFLFGGRILGMDESLSIEERLTAIPGNPAGIPGGTTFVVTDRFSTQNRFYGGQVGFAGEYRLGRFSFGGRAKLGLGVTEQRLQLAGNTLINNQQALNAFGRAGGLLVNDSTNGGSYRRSMFGIVPEVGMTLGYDVFDWMRVTAGYNFLYWNSVVRPGEQVDQRVNQGFFPSTPAGRLPAGVNPGAGPLNPAPMFKSSDMYVHGVTFGLEFRY